LSRRNNTLSDGDAKHKREQIETGLIGELVSAALNVDVTFTFTPRMDQVDKYALHNSDLGTAQANMKYFQYKF